MISDFFNLKEGKAQGGIASGPETGYFEKLHGTEAVVPLPDGKSIPVIVQNDFSDLRGGGGDINAIVSKLSQEITTAVQTAANSITNNIQLESILVGCFFGICQINFLPDFIHTYLFPREYWICPIFKHLEPILTDAFAGEMSNEVNIMNKRVVLITFLFAKFIFQKLI